MTPRILHSIVVMLACASLHGLAAPPTDAEMLKPFPHPKGYLCTQTSQPITIDGKLDDQAWVAAPWSDAFVDIEGDTKPKPTFRTRVKMLWDADALYIAAELEEPHIWGTLTQHDAVIFADNDFEVFLDPDGDNHFYGELEINARNTTWDLLLTRPYKDGGKAINAWEITGLKTAVHVDGTLNDPANRDTGWTIEIRWPFTCLKELARCPVPPRAGDQWRINFSRVEWDCEVKNGQYQKLPGRAEHNWVWSPQGVIDMHRPERWGYLQFCTGDTHKQSFRLDADWETRDLLHRVYYAQRLFHSRNHRYTSSLLDLDIREPEQKVEIDATRSSFTASMNRTRPENNSTRRFTMTSDGLFLFTER